ncbi:MAG TPA: DinB family protein [Candidatus Limnocylindria bacterium]|nr:DinB family protein [Candidatus Limnocylindria bacterium]
MPPPAWLEALERRAPDVVACWEMADELRPLRRELRSRVRRLEAMQMLDQQEALGDALEEVLRLIPDQLLRAPGGEEDWNVAQAFAHATAARRFLVAWAALSAAGEWPDDDAPVVRPSIPGRADASREELLVLLDKSRGSLRQSAATIAGHELDHCPLEHPLVGRLRCGEWLLFVGVHDLMHLEQLHRLLATGSGRGDDLMGWTRSETA